jgi:hypothetical protein
MYCNKCGGSIPDASAFCNHCGIRAGATADKRWSSESKAVVALTALSALLLAVTAWLVSGRETPGPAVAQAEPSVAATARSSSSPSQQIARAVITTPSASPIRAPEIQAPSAAPSAVHDPQPSSERGTPEAGSIRSHFIAIFNHSIRAWPGQWHQRQFQIHDTWIKPRLRGWFRASGGANDIEVYVITDEQFEPFQAGKAFFSVYASGRVSATSVDVPLTPGVYYLIISNRWAQVTSKIVDVDLRLVFGSKQQ